MRDHVLLSLANLSTSKTPTLLSDSVDLFCASPALLCASVGQCGLAIDAHRSHSDFHRHVHHLALVGRQINQLTSGHQQRRSDIDRVVAELDQVERSGLLPDLNDGRFHGAEDLYLC